MVVACCNALARAFNRAQHGPDREVPASGPREGCPHFWFALGRSSDRRCGATTVPGVRPGRSRESDGDERKRVTSAWARGQRGSCCARRCTPALCELRRPRRAAAPFGLYDPARDKDSCGVGIHCRHQGPQVAQDRRRCADHSRQSRTPRCGRRRSARRRRRRHPGADPAQVLRPQGSRDSASRCRSPANTASARCSCRATPSGASSCARPSNRSQPRKA